MIEHLWSSEGEREARIGLPSRSRPEPEASEPGVEQGGAEASAPAPRKVWVRSERGWSPTSWRLGGR